MSAEVAARLRGQIARYDISQAELALLCDVSQSQFSKIIRGTRPMTVDQMAVICEALGVDMGQFISEIEEFLTGRDLYSSAVVYVEEEARMREPLHVAAEFLDEWGEAARERLSVAGRADVRGRQQDYDLVANDSIDETRTDEDLY